MYVKNWYGDSSALAGKRSSGAPLSLADALAPATPPGYVFGYTDPKFEECAGSTLGPRG